MGLFDSSKNFREITEIYVTFYNGEEEVIKKELSQDWEFVVNYVYDDGWTEGGSGTVSGSGTIPLEEPDWSSVKITDSFFENNPAVAKQLCECS